MEMAFYHDYDLVLYFLSPCFRPVYPRRSDALRRGLRNKNGLNRYRRAESFSESIVICIYSNDERET